MCFGLVRFGLSDGLVRFRFDLSRFLVAFGFCVRFDLVRFDSIRFDLVWFGWLVGWLVDWFE